MVYTLIYNTNYDIHLGNETMDDMKLNKNSQDSKDFWVAINTLEKPISIFIKKSI